METPVSGGRRRLLIVDDNPELVASLQDFFQDRYDVDTATSGADSLACARRIRPDVVLLDIAMPKMDGVAVLRRLRALEPGMRVIMLSANEDIAVADAALAAGAAGYVEKPFVFGALDRKVSDAVR